MATKVETRNTGIKKAEKDSKTFRELTSVVEKKRKRQDGDAEAGVDPQVDQLNNTPNDPNSRPKEYVYERNNSSAIKETYKMNKLTWKGRWNELKGKVKQEYDLTDKDLLYSEGKENELLERLQKKTGKTKEEVENWLNDLK